MAMERVRKKKMGVVTITEIGRTLENWIDWLEKNLWQGITWINDLDKVELLELLKELERRRAKDGRE